MNLLGIDRFITKVSLSIKSNLRDASTNWASILELFDLNPSLKTKYVHTYLSRFCHTNDETHLEEKISVHIISHSFKFIQESLCVKSQMSSTNFEIELCALLLEIHGM